MKNQPYYELQCISQNKSTLLHLLLPSGCAGPKSIDIRCHLSSLCCASLCLSIQQRWEANPQQQLINLSQAWTRFLLPGSARQLPWKKTPRTSGLIRMPLLPKWQAHPNVLANKCLNDFKRACPRVEMFSLLILAVLPFKQFKRKAHSQITHYCCPRLDLGPLCWNSMVITNIALNPPWHKAFHNSINSFQGFTWLIKLTYPLTPGQAVFSHGFLWRHKQELNGPTWNYIAGSL